MVFFALNFISVATILYLLLGHAIGEKKRIQMHLEEAYQKLQREEQRANELLLNVLPEAVARRLKEAPTSLVADRIDEACVMFADIVDFTKLAGQLPPSEVFTLLNRIFSAFDDLTQRYHLERIKTIGDAYMVAGGLFGGGQDPVRAMANLALDIQRIMRRDFRVNSAHLAMRIGIASGPVLAGIIGKQKFIYDLWGDTVNLASRLCSEGAPGTILCDEATWRRLHPVFSFGSRQILDLKGIGTVAAYPLAEAS